MYMVFLTNANAYVLLDIHTPSTGAPRISPLPWTTPNHDQQRRASTNGQLNPRCPDRWLRTGIQMAWSHFNKGGKGESEGAKEGEGEGGKDSKEKKKKKGKKTRKAD